MAPSSPSPAESTEVHTRLLRLALGIEESRVCWAHVDPAVPVAGRVDVAFEGRWFGAKSTERVRYLLLTFAARYDVFPEALEVLRRQRQMEPSTAGPTPPCRPSWPTTSSPSAPASTESWPN